MTKILKFGAILSLSFFMMACASQPLKAPCDEHAHFCGTKTKINQW